MCSLIISSASSEAPGATGPVFMSIFCTSLTKISEVLREPFLASQDALEVMLVSQSVSESLTLRTELTDVTLVSEDTY